jgi:hypothetical protein
LCLDRRRRRNRIRRSGAPDPEYRSRLADRERLAFNGADGLRDLRDPTTAHALLRAASHEDPDVAVTAAHALVSMASPTVPVALDALAGHVDERARALSGRWAAQWARREDLGA